MRTQIQLATFLILLFMSIKSEAQNNVITLGQNFEKIIISPHIETVFMQGDESSIQVESITVPVEKLKYELKNKTLQVYLEGAKTTTKNKKIKYNGMKRKVPIYKGTVAKVIVTYKSVDIFSLRGEEKIFFKSPLIQNECTLRVFGESEVLIKKIELDKLYVSIYGNSFLNMEEGIVGKQKITAYGASKIMAMNVKSKETKITAYGDGTFKFNVSERLKVTAYGEATIMYKGEAKLSKGLIIGESEIIKL